MSKVSAHRPVKKSGVRIRSGVRELPDAWREKIREGKIFERLVDCVHGKIEMTSNQIRAAEIILRKIVPDLQRSEVKVDTGDNALNLLTAVEIAQMIDSIGRARGFAVPDAVAQIASGREANKPITLNAVTVQATDRFACIDVNTAPASAFSDDVDSE